MGEISSAARVEDIVNNKSEISTTRVGDNVINASQRYVINVSRRYCHQCESEISSTTRVGDIVNNASRRYRQQCKLEISSTTQVGNILNNLSRRYHCDGDIV